MTWWLWAVLGLVLCAIELATPGGFFIVFFGVAALVIALLQLIGLNLPAWVQWLAFPVLAIVALRLFRRPLLQRLQPDASGDVDSLVGEVAMPVTAIAPGEFGRVEARGTVWSARNVGATAVGAGQRGRIVAVNGLQLDIRPE